MCGEHPTITEPIDYEQFCGVPALDPKSLAETVAEAKSSKGSPAADPSLDAKGLPPGYAFDPTWEVTPREVKSLLDKNEKFVFIDCRITQRICNYQDRGRNFDSPSAIGGSLQRAERARGRKGRRALPQRRSFAAIRQAA